MSANTFEIFLHADGSKPKIAAVEDTAVLHDVLVDAGIFKNAGNEQKDVLVFIGEFDEDDVNEDDGDDGEDKLDPVDPKQTVKDLGLRRLRHVHCTRCRRVEVEVTFLGKTKKRKFAPVATIGRVTKWARRKFRIDTAVASEYVLQICGTTTVPRSDVHLSDLPKQKCSLCFNLVKEVTPQG